MEIPTDLPEGMVALPEFISAIGVQCDCLPAMHNRTPVYARRIWDDLLNMYNVHELRILDDNWQKYETGKIQNVVVNVARYMWACRTGTRFPTVGLGRYTMDWVSNWPDKFEFGVNVFMNYRGGVDQYNRDGVGAVFYRVKDPVSGDTLLEGDIAVMPL